MDLTNEVLLWWWAIGLRYARPLEGHDLQRAVRVLQHALHRDTPPLAVSSQLAARSSQPSRLAYKNARPPWTRSVRPTLICPCIPTTTIAQSITRNSDGNAPRDAARRRARPQPQPARLHRPLPAVARRRRRARTVVPLHPQGPHGAAEPPTPERRPRSSQAMRGV
jgi:hypothetical protein